jgi:integrase
LTKTIEARYLAGIYPGTEIPPLSLMPYRQRWRPPFIYSTADFEPLMDQTRISTRSPLRAATYETLLGLLAAGGLRIGEAITLDRNDIDWSESLLLIRESKFGKSRLVPLHSTTMQALTAYGELRGELEPRPEEQASSCLRPTNALATRSSARRCGG